MDYKDKADKYEKRYWFWQLSGKEYVSFYYMTLAVVLIELFFPNIITFFLGGLCLLLCIFYVPYGIWRGGKEYEDQYLFNCYKKSLLLSTHHQIKSIAFPNISTGIYGYSKDQAAQIAIAAVKSHQKSPRKLEDVIFCCFEKENYEIYSELLENTNIWLEIEEELIKIGGNQVLELGEA